MKKLLLIIFILLLLSCNIIVKTETQIFLVTDISEGYGNYKLEVILRRDPFVNYEFNIITLLTNDVSIQIGDKFKLTKVEE